MRLKLHWQILIALILAAFAGSLVRYIDPPAYNKAGTAMVFAPGGFGAGAVAAFGFVGELFLNLLKMLIVPLIVASIVTGVAGLGQIKGFARLGFKTVAWYACTSLVAILIGLTLVNLIGPGRGLPEAARQISPDAVSDLQQKVEGRSGSDVAEIFLRMVPTNVFQSAAETDMLGLIFFSILFGAFMLKVAAEYQAPVLAFFKGVYEIMLKLTEFVMLVAPIGVFGLVASEIARTGFSKAFAVAWFFFTVLGGLAIHMFIALPLLLMLVGRANPARHFKAMGPAMLTAFSTASSTATLPVTIRCVEERAGVSNRIASFVLPLGATVNMDGTALYECVVVLFIAQTQGIDLSFGQQFLVVWLALLTSIGVAGIPAASLVAIAIILRSVGLPVEAIGLVLVVDRVLDMCRTSVNIFSDATGAVAIARTEGEAEVLRKPGKQAIAVPPEPEG